MYLAVRLVVAWGANILALIVADWVFSGFVIERWGTLLLAGAVFGLANVFLKPLLTFIAIPLIILTFGIAYFFVNVAILAFTEWVVPNFSIDGFWTYVGAVIVPSTYARLYGSDRKPFANWYCRFVCTAMFFVSTCERPPKISAVCLVSSSVRLKSSGSVGSMKS